MKEYLSSADDVLSAQGADGESGLSEAAASERLAKHGPNKLKEEEKTPLWIRFFQQMADPMVIMLIVAAIISAATGMIKGEADWADVIIIMFVVVVNSVLGVAQEAKSEEALAALQEMSAAQSKVMRGGKLVHLPSSELVPGDVVLLEAGDAVPADCRVLESASMKIEEAALTGESVPIAKGIGDELLSGSFIETGSLVARVVRVGREGYAAKINAEAKYVKAVKSEILDTLRAIIKIGTIILVPLGLGLFLRTLLMDGGTIESAILTSTSAVLGMIPQGLVLLTSSVLAIATTRLAHRQVLVQQPYCVETLARVDTLCLDKTGTITSGQMEVSGVACADGHGEDEVVRAFACVARANAQDANETARALLGAAEARGAVTPERYARAVPFSSARKYSGCVTPEGECYAIGAAAFVLGPEGSAMADACGTFDEMERVMVCCRVPGFSREGAIEGEPELLGCVAIRDQIRPTAPATMEYFREQGVELRVISGDDPRTVSAIAERAGVPGARAYVDASTLEDEAAIEDAVDRYRVFGRVTPQQKRDLVKALHRRGRTVAMTGDGVNDVLALREADCSVSMASGSAAARNVSEIVLADNDFSHMPEVVAEGRRSINNLQRSASLFLVKTVFTAVLALICIFMPPYPFIPIQMSLISTAVIGIPSFVLALEPNHERIRGNFLANVLARSLPASLAIVCALFAELALGRLLDHSFAEISTVCMMITVVIGLALIYRISRPLTPLRSALLVAMSGLVLLSYTVFGEFFHVVRLPRRGGLHGRACRALHHPF